MLKVAIIGCGKIADSHAEQIARVPGCQLVAACDSDDIMAQQLADRFNVSHCFTDVRCMLESVRPKVVHITTPPASHFRLARTCIEHGSHVYVEKPFTTTREEARELIASAESRNLKLTVGHDAQFSHAAVRLRELVQSGYLGGPPVHIESTYCYDLGDTYGHALLSDKNHWVRNLPGKLLHNIISHGVARIAEFVTSELKDVKVIAFTSSPLRRQGETEIIDELRVFLRDSNDTTAYFTFSSSLRPFMHHFSVFGSKNGLRLDDIEQTVILLSGTRHKSYAANFVPPFYHIADQLRNLYANLGLFAKNDFHMKSGMKTLIQAFYQSVITACPTPIPSDEIVRTSDIMDRIFSAINAGTGHPVRSI